MIEINLLPEELRRTEGTPPARMLAILGSIVAACGLVFFIGQYHLIKIPSIKSDLATIDVEIKKLKEDKVAVEKVRADITTIESKVAALENLQQSRVRFGRLLDRLCNSVPDGVWFRTFTIAPDSLPPQPGGGKRYMISLSGYATGATPLEMDRKLIELMNNMKREFSVRPEGPAPANAPASYGWSKFINAKFDRPNLIGKVLVKSMNPLPSDIDPKIRKNIEVPNTGLDFNMTFSFEMPAPKVGA